MLVDGIPSGVVRLYRFGVIDESAIRQRFEALAPVLDERGRRRFAAAEATSAGHGAAENPKLILSCGVPMATSWFWKSSGKFGPTVLPITSPAPAVTEPPFAKPLAGPVVEPAAAENLGVPYVGPT